MPEETLEAGPPDPASAVVVPFSVPPALARVRRRWDRAALDGAGPHVTVLYPFLPCSALGRPIRDELVEIAGTVSAFEVLFERVRCLDGVVWIEPEPSQPFAALTAAIVERWPSHPPYGGMFDIVVPHLTAVESDGAALDAVETVAHRVVPFPGRADRLETWCRDRTGRWRTHWRIPLPVRP